MCREILTKRRADAVLAVPGVGLGLFAAEAELCLHCNERSLQRSLQRSLRAHRPLPRRLSHRLSHRPSHRPSYRLPYRTAYLSYTTTTTTTTAAAAGCQSPARDSSSDVGCGHEPPAETRGVARQEVAVGNLVERGMPLCAVEMTADGRATIKAPTPHTHTHTHTHTHARSQRDTLR